MLIFSSQLERGFGSSGRSLNICEIRNGLNEIIHAMVQPRGAIQDLEAVTTTIVIYSFFFFFFFFGHPEAYRVPWPGIRFKSPLPLKPQLQQHRILNPLCQAGDRTFFPLLPGHRQSICTRAGSPLLLILMRKGPVFPWSSSEKHLN